MPALDNSPLWHPQLAGPTPNAAEVVPADTSDLSVVADALYIGMGGTLRLTTLRGQTVTLTVWDGSVLPIRTTRVHATGTTAGAIVALWT